MMEEKCPFCGSEKRRPGAFECETQYFTRSRSFKCYEAEITLLKEELTAFKESYEKLHSMHHECCKDNFVLKSRLEKLERVREAASELKGVSDRLDRALEEMDA